MIKTRPGLIFTISILSITCANSADRFSLPENKTTIIDCQTVVLTLHPGYIKSEKTIRQPSGQIEIHFEVSEQANKQDAVDWLVICDGSSGKILKDIKLDEAGR